MDDLTNFNLNKIKMGCTCENVNQAETEILVTSRSQNSIQRNSVPEPSNSNN